MDTSAPPLSALIERAASGDEEAWAALVERFSPLLWSVCRRFRLSRADADDVAQAVWLRLIEHLSTLREPAALPGWLATTTRRECLRVAQGSRRRQDRELPLKAELVTDEHAVALDHDLLRAERFDALRAAFAGLGERCRRLLELLIKDPAPGYLEISDQLGMPIGSIGPTRARCLESLRRVPQLAALLSAETPAGGTP